MHRNLLFAPVVAAVFAGSSALAQQTGVSHPPEAPVEQVAEPVFSTPVIVAAPAVIATPAVLHTADGDRPAVSIAPADATPATHPVLHARSMAADDPDAGIVTDVPTSPTEVPAGTTLRIRLRSEVATDSTAPNAPFTAELTENIEHRGRVVVPAGSLVEGRVTGIRGGTRLRGRAMIHLQAETVVMPDGTRVALHAAVIDTDQYANTRVDDEGNILRKDHVGATLAAMSLTTGGAAAAGGVIAGVPGALVGAGIGAGLSTAWWLKQDRQTHLPKDTLVVLGLTAPLPIVSLVHEPVNDPAFSEYKPYKPSAAVPMASPAPALPLPQQGEPQAFVPGN